MLKNHENGIGLFGLTGDPVHNGHVRVVSIIRQLPYLDDLWIHVNYAPYYKKPMFSFFHRQMFASSSFIDAMVMDGEYNYTYQAIRHLRKIYGKKMPIYFFVGTEWDVGKFKNGDYVKKNCIVMNIPKIEISIRSTQIREMIKQDKPLDGLVPETVQLNIENLKESNEISI